MSRRTIVGWIVVGVVVIIAAGLASYAWLNPVNIGTPATDYVVATADFGFRRTQLTRSFDLYLCESSYADLNLAECPGASGGGSTNAANADARPTRPEIVSTTVGGELRQVDNGEPIAKDGSGCKLMPHGSQFPSSQVKAVAENRGAADLVVSVIADSSQPEEVRPGTYCGTVTVARASGADIPLWVLASVGDRGQGALRLRVFLALLFGALIGATVKWLGDRYAPVAGLRRRQRRLIRRFGAWRDYLPERAQYDLAVVEDGIGSFDPDGVDASMSELEQQGDSLTRFASAMAELDRLIAAQEEFTSADFEPPVAHVLAAEYARVARFRGEKFPWKDPDQVAEDADELRNAAKAIVVSLEAGDATSYRQCAESVVGTVEEDQVRRIADGREGRIDVRRVMLAGQPVVVKGSESRTVAQILLDNSLLITMVVGALVVAFVGFQTQFVGDPSFDAGNGDYLKLFAWAFALQVAGVTVLEVAGKLLTSAAGGGQPAAPAPAPR